MIEDYWGVRGIFEAELEHGAPFRWLTIESTLWIPHQEGNYFIFNLFSPFEDLEQVITLHLDHNKKPVQLVLLNGWHQYAVARTTEEYMTITALKALPRKTDERILTVRVSTIKITDHIPQEVVETEKKIAQLRATAAHALS